MDGPQRKKLRVSEKGEEFCLKTAALKKKKKTAALTPVWVSSLLAYSTYFDLPASTIIALILKINLFTYILLVLFLWRTLTQ